MYYKQCSIARSTA
jgi:hypothetical protein